MDTLTRRSLMDKISTNDPSQSPKYEKRGVKSLKKKPFIILLLVSMIISAAAPVFAADTVTAKPTASTVLVNGRNVAFDAYNINSNNYFKLRDLAYTLSGTAKQFDLGWDGANNAISLTSGQPYTTAGGEMQGKGAGDKKAVPTASRTYLDGKEISFTAYNIEGSNYFKLRDIGAVFDFGVDWDGARNTIAIDTGKGYTPETTALLTQTPMDGTVDVLFDSRYYAYGDQLLKTELFSYQDEVYVPLQGIFEASWWTFSWDEATQAASITRDSVTILTPQLEEIAERWAYPMRGRGDYRADYVRLIEYDAETGTLVCAGRETTYSFRLTEQAQGQFQELLAQGLATGDIYRLVPYFPWPYPVGAGHPSPEAWDPIFVELSYPYSVERQAIVRPITVNVEVRPIDKGGIPVLLSISVEALEYNGLLYVPVTALEQANIQHWWGSWGSIVTE